MDENEKLLLNRITPGIGEYTFLFFLVVAVSIASVVFVGERGSQPSMFVTTEWVSTGTEF